MRASLAPLLVLALAAAPVALAQDPPPTMPSPDTGNEGEPPGPEESLEGGPGIATGVLVAVLSLSVGAVLAILLWKQRGSPPPP